MNLPGVLHIIRELGQQAYTYRIAMRSIDVATSENLIRASRELQEVLEDGVHQGLLVHADGKGDCARWVLTSKEVAMNGT